LNRMKVHNLLPYIIGGIAMWYFMFHSGVHSTIAGVLLAFAIPFGDGKEKSPSYILQKALHYPVAFFILPLFALANTAIQIPANWQEGLFHLPSTGIIAGLVAGKPLGILLFSYLAVITGVCILPSDMKWKQIAGIGFLGGIGFTMSIFITLLAYDDINIIAESKIAVITASVISGITGYIWLKVSNSVRSDVSAQR
jgi:Na+:H+ antiporter, NhaA family